MTDDWYAKDVAAAKASWEETKRRTPKHPGDTDEDICDWCWAGDGDARCQRCGCSEGHPGCQCIEGMIEGPCIVEMQEGAV